MMKYVWVYTTNTEFEGADIGIIYYSLRSAKKEFGSRWKKVSKDVYEIRPYTSNTFLRLERVKVVA